MDAMHLCPRATIRFPAVSAFTSSLGSSIVSLKDLLQSCIRSSNEACSIWQRLELSPINLPVGLKKKAFVISCISSPDGRKIRRGPQTPREEEANKTNSGNQEEIISLFQRLQSSISNETSTQGINNNRHSNKSSVLEIIRNSKKGKVEASTNYKLTRPHSNFRRRSPIPLPTAARGKKLQHLELLDDANANEQVMSQKSVSQLKLGELKEIAKSRGIKGYSKLKKRELLDLLNF